MYKTCKVGFKRRATENKNYSTLLYFKTLNNILSPSPLSSERDRQ